MKKIMRCWFQKLFHDYEHLFNVGSPIDGNDCVTTYGVDLPGIPIIVLTVILSQYGIFLPITNKYGYILSLKRRFHVQYVAKQEFCALFICVNGVKQEKKE